MTCTETISDEEKTQIKALLTALGKELHVETENMIDMATSLSATGPTYIFMVMEALTDAGVHLGFSREMSKELVQETILGSVLLRWNRTNIRRNSEIWSHRPAELQPTRFIKWKKADFARFCRKPFIPPIKKPSRSGRKK